MNRSIFKFVILTGLTISILGLFGCDNLKSPTDDDNSEGGNNNSNTITHSGIISSDETWSKDKIHVIDSWITIKNATVTIEAGATVEFVSGGEINVSTGGGLVADGSASPILFTGQTKQSGFWDYIEFKNDAVNANSRLINCIFEYGGGYSDNGALLYINNGATVKNCTIRHSASTGVKIDDEAQPIFENNTITSCKMPIQGYVKNAGFIGKGTYTGNTNNYIKLESGTINLSYTLLKQDVPYLFSNWCNIRNATLTIEAGTTIQMGSGAEIDVQTNGGLIADGSTEAITFTGAVQQNGYWDYIEFSSDAVNANSRLINCIIEYGGGYSNNAAQVYIDNSPTVKNCTIRYSSSNGVEIDDEANPTFVGNTITANTLCPVKGAFKSIASIGVGTYSGNGNDYLNISSGTLTQDATIPKQDVPYRLDGWHNISNATLTIAPGTVIQMNSGAELNVKENGGLIAQGTVDDSIHFTAAVQQKGYWDYIHFSQNAISSESILDYCIIEYGGGYSDSYGMIRTDNPSPTITNSLIRHSKSWGISYDASTTPTLANNTFFDNTQGDLTTH